MYDISNYIEIGIKEGRCLDQTKPISFESIEYCKENFQPIPFIKEMCGDICEKNITCYNVINNILECNLTKVTDKKTSDSLFLDDRLNDLFLNKRQTNATEYFKNTFSKKEQDNIIKYLDNVFYVGMIDTTDNTVCYVLDVTFLVIIIFLASVMVVKFLTSLFILAKQYPENIDKYIIVNMPCYTENKE